MRRFRDPDHALRIMLLVRGWVGTPVLYRGDTLHDGAIRLAAWRLGKFPGQPPKRVATTSRELTRLLVVCGETTRAQQLLGGPLEDYATAQAILQLDRELTEKVVNHRIRHKGRDYRAKYALQRIRRALSYADEDGRDSLELSELRSLIGEDLL